jgi:hypothetical protein
LTRYIGGDVEDGIAPGYGGFKRGGIAQVARDLIGLEIANVLGIAPGPNQ